jgi:hypothetical protein
MNRSSDLRELLKSWPYDPDADARIIGGDDGREVLQVRTPMGIEQYELDGRPDGLRPHGVESALDYHLARKEAALAAGGEAEFILSHKECGELFSESTLYYFRYVRLFQLKDWVRTMRDTERNLRCFDLVRQHAKREDDRQYLERWRPYIIRVNATAAAMQAIESRNYDRAQQLVEAAITAIEGLPETDDDTFRFERDRSLTALRELAKQVKKSRPLSVLERLEHQLKRAIENQEFERAADLRDRIRDLKKK